VKEDGVVNIGSEDEKTEFKKSTVELKDGIVAMASILNKHREGTLYFGVENDGNVIGQQIGANTVRNISQQIYNYIKPVPNISVNVLTSGDKNYIKVDFHGNELPYSADGKYYMRVSDENRALTHTQLMELLRSLEPSYSDWEEKCTDFGPDDINENTLIKSYEAGLKAGRFKEPYSDKETILNKLGLLKDGKLTNAGYYLYSKNEPIWLKAAVFATDAKLTFLDMNHFRGNIFECIDEGVLFISRNIRWAVKIGAITRTEIPEVPIDAIREIVVNSFAHARYFGTMVTHEINIFPSKISVFNPGVLPYGVNPEEYAAGEGASILRNPKIANVLLRCDRIEAYGSGFRRVISECESAGVRYQYRTEFDGFKFEFVRNPIPYVTGEDSALKLPKDLTENEIKICEIINANRSITGATIAEQMEMSESTVRRILRSLTEKGILKRTGSDRNGQWKVL
jgi:ATP-dependent DNA helicase RecG